MVGCLAQGRAGVLNDLEQKIRAIEGHARPGERGAVAAGGGGMPALRAGTLHEWCGVIDGEGCDAFERRHAAGQNVGGWTPPLLLLTHLARQAHTENTSRDWVIWIGRRIWPHPRILAAAGVQHDLLPCSLFVDVPDDAGRVWAIDLALHCPAACAVIADGSNLRLPHTRRLQLAAERSRALVLLARPHDELHVPSSASTRWVVARARSPGGAPRWNVELVRCKGAQQKSIGYAGVQWMLEWDRETGCLRVPADVADRPAAAKTARKTG